MTPHLSPPSRTPRQLAVAVTLALALATAGIHAQSGGDALRQTLEQAKETSGRSVTLHVQGSTIALLVTEVSAEHVIGRNAQHDRIVVRIDRIDAVAF